MGLQRALHAMLGVSSEEIDLKAQRALDKGITCDVTGLKLWKAQE
jgi:hypothetical protein